MSWGLPFQQYFLLLMVYKRCVLFAGFLGSFGKKEKMRGTRVSFPQWDFKAFLLG